MEAINEKMVDIAQRFCGLVPGDRVSTAYAQWALESGYGRSTRLGGILFRDFNNWCCIKLRAESPSLRSGEHEGHARFRTLEDCAIERAEILGDYQRAAWREGRDHWDIIGLLDRSWAPGQTYAAELRAIIKQGKLWKLDPYKGR